MKIAAKGKGKKRVQDFRIRFNGEIRSNTGVWTQKQCRAVLEEFWLFLNRQEAVYQDLVIIATPARDEGGGG